MTIPTNERLATLEQKVDDVKNDVAEIKDALKTLGDNLVTQQEFWPVKTLVFGFAGILLIAVITIVIVNPFKQAADQQTITITTQNPDGSTTTKVIPVSSGATSSTSTTPATTNPSGNTSTTTAQTPSPSPAPSSNPSPLQRILNLIP